MIQQASNDKILNELVSKLSEREQQLEAFRGALKEAGKLHRSYERDDEIPFEVELNSLAFQIMTRYVLRKLSTNTKKLMIAKIRGIE